MEKETPDEEQLQERLDMPDRLNTSICSSGQLHNNIMAHHGCFRVGRRTTWMWMYGHPTGIFPFDSHDSGAAETRGLLATMTDLVFTNLRP